MTPSDAQLERARYIRTILAYHGDTQTDLGRLLGCSQFSDDELLMIADHYGVDPANMLRPPELDGMLGSLRSAVLEVLHFLSEVGPDLRLHTVTDSLSLADSAA
jgi:hypothetical protein